MSDTAAKKDAPTPKRPRPQPKTKKPAESPLPHFSIKDAKTFKNFYASARARWFLTSWKVKLGYYAGFIILGTLIAYLANQPPLYGAAAAAGIGCFVGILLTTPETLKTALVLLFTTPLYWFTSVQIEASYAQYMKTSRNVITAFDPAASLTGYIILTILALWIALLWGKGKLWVTILLLQISGVAVAVPLSQMVPQYGIWILYATFAVVLALRCGSIFWGANTWKDYRTKNQHPKTTPPTPKQFFYLSKWDKNAHEHKRIDKTLRQHIEDGECVIGNVRAREGAGEITRFLINRKGIFLIIDNHESGPLRETAGEGVMLKNTNLGDIATVFAISAKKLAKILKTSPKNFRNILVLSGKNIPVDFAKETTIYDRSNPLPYGYIQLVSPNMLESELARGEDVFSEKKQKWVERYLRQNWLTNIQYTPLPAPTHKTVDDVSTQTSPWEETEYSTTTGVFGPFTTAATTEQRKSSPQINLSLPRTTPPTGNTKENSGGRKKRTRKRALHIPHHLIPQSFPVPRGSVAPLPPRDRDGG